MTTTITGLGSGFDIDSWVSSLVSAKEDSWITPLETKLSTLQTKSSGYSSLKSKYSTLQSALQTFTKTIYNSTSDMWSNTSITSSNNAYATATSSGNVSAASINLEIEQIATSTVASSSRNIGEISGTQEYVDSILNSKFTNLANGQAQEGTFSLFLDGKEYDLEIEENDTVQDVIDSIYEATDGKIQAAVDTDGFFSITAYKEEDGALVEDTDAVLTLGSGADESNIFEALKLLDAQGTNSYKSSYAISTVQTGAAFSSSESGLNGLKFFDEDGNEATSGKITINGVDFTVNGNTTLDDLISRINGNSDSNVKASYDTLTNKVTLTSTETGQCSISLSEEGTNLLNVLGLTEYTYDASGNIQDEILASGSQVLGQNAIAYVNGNKVISNSNTITGESSGITNLSITIKKPTSEYSSNPDDDKDVTLDIEHDFTKVKEALNTFVSAYNDVVNTTKTYTASDGAIGSDSTLNTMVTNLKSAMSGTNSNDGIFNMLSQIGISTSSTNTTNLSIDSTKLDEALNENFSSVKQLLSDGYTSSADTGLFDEMSSLLTNYLDASSGYFTQMSDSVDSQIDTVNSSLERANTRLTSYQTRITNQFNKMDSTLASLNSQLSTFQAYIG